MATPSKLNAPAKIHTEQVAPADSLTTTEDIVRELVAKGRPLEKIRIPGKVESHIRYIAEDFDSPVDDFKDYERLCVMDFILVKK